VAVLLEEGLRNGSIVLSHPEYAKEQAESHEFFARFLRFAAELALAAAIAPLLILPFLVRQEWAPDLNYFGKISHFLTGLPGFLIAVPVVLVGYHRLLGIIFKQRADRSSHPDHSE